MNSIDFFIYFKVASDTLYSLSNEFRKQKICNVWFGPMPRVMLYDREVVGQVMNEHLNRSPEYSSFQHVPTVVFNAEEKQWRPKRKQMLPAFTVNTVQHYIPIIDRHVHRMMSSLFPNDRPIEEVPDMFPKVSLLLLQIVFDSCFGPPVVSDAKMLEFMRHAHGFFQGVMVKSVCVHEIVFRMTSVGRQFYKDVAWVNQCAGELFDQRLATYDKQRGKQTMQEFVKNKPNQYFIDIMLQIYYDEQASQDSEMEKYTKRTLVGELLLFIFGGFDTVATATTWIIYCLGNDRLI